MGIKTVPHPSYNPDLAPCDFWISPKLRGYRYEIIEEMKEALTKVIDTLTEEDFHGAFQKLLERYNKCIAVPIQKKSGILPYAPFGFVFFYITKKDLNMSTGKKIIHI